MGCELSTGDLLRRAQGRMARALLAASREVDPRLGRLTLRPHQCAAAARLLEIIHHHGGALLADAVGLGKTYVALAVARQYPRVLVICPAALRVMWTRALTIASIEADIISTEALSRGALLATPVDLVIVDEAHHFRTPGTRRHDGLAEIARHAHVLLLTATPLHNSRRDLTAMLGVFAGSGIGRWSDAALARLIVRRDENTAHQNLPRLSGPHGISPGTDDDCLEAIVRLPPAVPASDEGVAHALNTIAMLHMWSSSRAALVTSVRKRLARATALRDAVAAGHVPTALELSAWQYADNSLQLALPFFASTTDTTIHTGSLAPQLERFIDASRALISHCMTTPDPDLARAKLLRVLREKHAGQRIVAFSQYATTIAALGRLMRADAGVATVTGDGAAIASGRLARHEVLAQFAADVAKVNPIERIGLLLATDLFSEGIDLRGASVVVHLDMPWNPARMEQRVGRLRRMGSAFEETVVYSFLPPAAAERVLELERRLRAKVATAQAVIGGVDDPFGIANEHRDSGLAAGEKLRAMLHGWVASGDTGDDATPVIAAAECCVNGWIALVFVAGEARLIANVGGAVVEDAERSLAIVAAMCGELPVSSERRDAALADIAAWIAAREVSEGAGLEPEARRAVLERLTRTIARAPRHRRPGLIGSAQRARITLSDSNGVGAERVLDALARSSDDDETWLQSLDSFCSSNPVERRSMDQRNPIVAVILLTDVRASGAATPERSEPS